MTQKSKLHHLNNSFWGQLQEYCRKYNLKLDEFVG